MTTEAAIKIILEESREDYMDSSSAGLEGDKVNAISGSIDALLVRMAVNWLRDNSDGLITEGQIVRRMEREIEDKRRQMMSGVAGLPEARLREALEYSISLLTRGIKNKEK